MPAKQSCSVSFVASHQPSLKLSIAQLSPVKKSIIFKFEIFPQGDVRYHGYLSIMLDVTSITKRQGSKYGHRVRNQSMFLQGRQGLGGGDVRAVDMGIQTPRPVPMRPYE